MVVFECSCVKELNVGLSSTLTYDTLVVAKMKCVICLSEAKFYRSKYSQVYCEV